MIKIDWKKQLYKFIKEYIIVFILIYFVSFLRWYKKLDVFTLSHFYENIMSKTMVVIGVYIFIGLLIISIFRLTWQHLKQKHGIKNNLIIVFLYTIKDKYSTVVLILLVLLYMLIINFSSILK